MVSMGVDGYSITSKDQQSSAVLMKSDLTQGLLQVSKNACISKALTYPQRADLGIPYDETRYEEFSKRTSKEGMIIEAPSTESEAKHFQVLTDFTSLVQPAIEFKAFWFWERFWVVHYGPECTKFTIKISGS